MENRYCPRCGNDVDVNQAEDDELACDNCYDTFWASETLPENYHDKGLFTMNELMNRKEVRK